MEEQKVQEEQKVGEEQKVQEAPREVESAVSSLEEAGDKEGFSPAGVPSLFKVQSEKRLDSQCLVKVESIKN